MGINYYARIKKRRCFLTTLLTDRLKYLSTRLDTVTNLQLHEFCVFNLHKNYQIGYLRLFIPIAFVRTDPATFLSGVGQYLSVYKYIQYSYLVTYPVFFQRGEEV